MTDTSTPNKKKWSKKKKIIVITSAVVGALLAIILCVGIGMLNWYCKPADYTVTSSYRVANDDTRLIAHRGFRAVAPENTAPAFEKAGQAGFWGAECDVYRTKDGVWVVQHDFNTYRMMDCTRNIEHTKYDTLKKHVTDNGSNIANFPQLKICTLDRYLSICDRYGMTAVIELKSKNNTEHYDEIVRLMDEHPCTVVFISFNEENLKAMRQLTDEKMFYLVQEITVDDIRTAKNIPDCGIDFNAGKEKNFADNAAIIKKCQDSKLSLGVWTVNDIELMQKCVDLGIDYITTDCITY